MNKFGQFEVDDVVIDKESLEHGIVHEVKPYIEGMKEGLHYIVEISDPIDTPAMRIYVRDELELDPIYGVFSSEQEDAIEKHLNIRPEMTPSEIEREVEDRMGGVMDEALTHLHNVLDFIDELVLGNQSEIVAARKFLADMEPDNEGGE